MKLTIKQKLSAAGVAIFFIGSMLVFASPNYEAKIQHEQDNKIEYNQSADRLRGELEVMEARVLVLRKEISSQKSLYAVSEGKIAVYKELLSEGL